MNIVEIKDKSRYNANVREQKHSQFLQSWEWGEFQKSVGNKVLRFGVENNGKIEFALTLIKNNLPFGISYFYAPRIGIKYLSEERLVFLFKEIKKKAKNEKVIFLRFDPRSKAQIINHKSQIVKTIDIQPGKTLILDIDKSEEEILKQMHQKTRYNIKLAVRKSVEVKVVKDIDKYFDEFWQLMAQTEKRDGFRLHNKNYYWKMLKSDKKFIKLIAAFYKNKMLCANIVSFFGNTAAYVHDSSANENRNLMAAFALQMFTIKLAKEYGFKYYDFNGIDEQKWPGVTRFKKGFGGEEVDYPGTYDLVFDSFKYNLYKILRWAGRKM